MRLLRCQPEKGPGWPVSRNTPAIPMFMPTWSTGKPSNHCFRPIGQSAWGPSGCPGRRSLRGQPIRMSTRPAMSPVFCNILEGCRQHPVKHLVFASTSSVYGANTRMPFSEHQSTEHPLTLYAATKKANEMMAHSYAHLYGIPATGITLFQNGLRALGTAGYGAVPVHSSDSCR